MPRKLISTMLSDVAPGKQDPSLALLEERDKPANLSLAMIGAALLAVLLLTVWSGMVSRLADRRGKISAMSCKTRAARSDTIRLFVLAMGQCGTLERETM